MTQGNAPFFVDNEVIRLNRNGVWIADGIEITHEGTCRMFARSLKKDAKGWFISVGRETKHIIVEDTAYFVLRIDGDATTGFELLLNDESRQRLDPTKLSYRPGRLTARIHAAPSDSEQEARFLHAPYFDLLRDLKEDAKGYYLEIAGKRVPLAAK